MFIPSCIRIERTALWGGVECACATAFCLKTVVVATCSAQESPPMPCLLRPPIFFSAINGIERKTHSDLLHFADSHNSLVLSCETRTPSFTLQLPPCLL